MCVCVWGERERERWGCERLKRETERERLRVWAVFTPDFRLPCKERKEKEGVSSPRDKEKVKTERKKAEG